MKSGKQRRAEIARKRQIRASAAPPAARTPAPPLGPTEPVDPAALAPYNSYGTPEFVQRGVYCDIPFTCADCGTDCVFTAAQQKWWYEVAKGQVYSRAKRCRACRRARQGKPPAA